MIVFSQFIDYTYFRPIKHAFHVNGIAVSRLENRTVNTLVATNCSQNYLSLERNRTLDFAISRGLKSDLRDLNMSDCFKGKLNELLFRNKRPFKRQTTNCWSHTNDSTYRTMAPDWFRASSDSLQPIQSLHTDTIAGLRAVICLIITDFYNRNEFHRLCEMQSTVEIDTQLPSRHEQQAAIFAGHVLS